MPHTAFENTAGQGGYVAPPVAMEAAGETTEEDDAISSDWDDENHMTVRAKWILDSCASIDDIIERLRQEIRYYESLKQTGWELTAPIDDDYGFMRKAH